MTADKGVKLVIIAVAGLPLAFVIRLLWKHPRELIVQAKAGAAILGHPGRYIRRVLLLQVMSYAARLGVNGTFMYAFGIPVTLRNIFLVAGSTRSRRRSRLHRAASAPSRPWPRWLWQTSLPRPPL